MSTIDEAAQLQIFTTTNGVVVDSGDLSSMCIGERACYVSADSFAARMHDWYGKRFGAGTQGLESLAADLSRAKAVADDISRASREEDKRGDSLLSELRAVLNRHSVESASDTPDFLLATYLQRCLDAYAEIVKARDKWFGVNPWGRPNVRPDGQPRGFDPQGEG